MKSKSQKLIKVFLGLVGDLGRTLSLGLCK